jgi:hypothetical protein
MIELCQKYVSEDCDYLDEPGEGAERRRDAMIGIFSVIGKILYNKRVEKTVDVDVFGVEKESDLNTNSSTSARPTLAFRPEVVIEKGALPPRVLCCFLHENYLNFFTELDDIKEGMNWLSISDLYQPPSLDPVAVSHMEVYSGLVGVRGMLWANQHIAPNAFRAFHKPEYFKYEKQRREINDNVIRIFSHSLYQRPVVPSLSFSVFPSLSFILQNGPFLLKRENAIRNLNRNRAPSHTSHPSHFPRRLSPMIPLLPEGIFSFGDRLSETQLECLSKFCLFRSLFSQITPRHTRMSEDDWENVWVEEVEKENDAIKKDRKDGRSVFGVALNGNTGV